MCGAFKSLQFDHIEASSKVYPIASMLAGCRWEFILSELAKCQLLCHPCHVFKGRMFGETGGTKGVGNHNAKLNPAKVQEMRWRSRAGETVSSLAAEFGVSTGAAWQAVNRGTWKHVK